MSLSAFDTNDTNIVNTVRLLQYRPSYQAQCSTEDIMSGQDLTNPPRHDSPKPDTAHVSNANSGSVQRRLLHRRSASIRAIDLSVYAPTQLPEAVFSSPSRFGHTSGTRPSTPKSPSMPNYPVIPVRPPLRPTVSFGSVSRHSYDSTRPISDQNMLYEVEKEVYIESLDPRKTNNRNFDLGFSCLCLLNVLCGFSITALSTAVPRVAHDLKLTAVETFWLPGSHLLSAFLIQPLAMRMSMALGSKPILLSCVVLFIIGSIVSSAASTFPVILLGRSIEGLGYGSTAMLSQLSLSQLTAIKDRARLQKAASHMLWLGIALGPVLGGAVTRYSSWRAIFYFQASVSVVSLAILTWITYLPLRDAGSLVHGLKQVNVLSWALLIGGVTPLLVSISIGGILRPWVSYETLLPMAMGLILLICWVLHSRTRPLPILPVTIFSNPTAVVTCIGAVLHGAVLTSIIFFTSILYQVNGLDMAISGLCLLPWTLGLLITSLAGGAALAWTGHRLTLWTGWALLCLAMGLMMIKNSSSLTICLPVTLIGGMAMGLPVPGLSAAMQSTVSNDEEVIYSDAIQLVFSTFGKCLGVVIGSSIFLNRLKFEIFGNPNLIDDAQNSWMYAISLLDQHLSGLEERVRANLILNYVDALRPIWIGACVAAGIALGLAVVWTADAKPKAAATTLTRIDDIAELE